MVPNSLGPGELLLNYGTDEQKRHYLPRLARGLDIPCFALTSPQAGSDAASIPDCGVVCCGEHEGRRVLGPARDVGQALHHARAGRDTARPRVSRVRPRSPGRRPRGPRHHLRADPDVAPGRASSAAGTCRSMPSSRTVPIRATTYSSRWTGSSAAQPMLGKGWRMLMECLAAGRGISLPSSNTGMAKLAVRATGGVRARAHAIQDADRQVRRHRGSADADGRQPLHDGRRRAC